MKGWLIASLKSTETRKRFQQPAIQKLVQDAACQCLMLHPYITALRTIINILLSLVEFRHWTLYIILNTPFAGSLSLKAFKF